MFQGIEKLYGKDKLNLLADLHATVIGVGGVGSWSRGDACQVRIGQYYTYRLR